jgi:phage baseplate assembly protein W
MARSDRYTVDSKRDVFYSDFTTNLDTHPVTGLLIRKTNENSVKQALKALVLTNLGERLYQPNIGGNITATLFEPMDNFAANDLRDAIRQTIFNNEPRVDQCRVIVAPNEARNEYDVTIEFTIHNRPDVTAVELVIKRLR